MSIKFSRQSANDRTKQHSNVTSRLTWVDAVRLLDFRLLVPRNRLLMIRLTTAVNGFLAFNIYFIVHLPLRFDFSQLIFDCFLLFFGNNQNQSTEPRNWQLKKRKIKLLRKFDFVSHKTEIQLSFLLH